ncbi:MAG: hypothetical protein WCE68_13720 [Anaerolineales bacterium]
MSIYQRSLSGESDFRAMEFLARETRVNNLHVIDLPYRLGSWASDDPENRKDNKYFSKFEKL